jgi:hypothetical protein
MNIYVGNLSFSVAEADLRDAFAAYGAVSTSSIIKDKFSGESRGFGFVEMPNKEEADKAIAALNGKDLKGRTMPSPGPIAPAPAAAPAADAAVLAAAAAAGASDPERNFLIPTRTPGWATLKTNGAALRSGPFFSPAVVVVV